MWDPGFSESSFGFRPGRNAHGAVKQVQGLIRTGRRWAVDIDLRKFFDTVDHRIVMSRLARKLEGQPLLRLIGRYLRAGVRVDGHIEPTREGVPQGGPLLPLLANIVLDDLDRMLDQRGHAFARYADDFVILVRSERAAQRVMAGVGTFLERRLKLRIHTGKKPYRAQFKTRLPRVLLRTRPHPAHRRGPAELQAGTPVVDRAAQVGVDERAPCQAAVLCAGVDELLRTLRRLSRLAGSGQLAAAADSDVQLGDVETSPAPHPQSARPRCPDPPGGRPRPQQSRPMEVCPIARVGDVKELAGKAGPHLPCR